MIRVGKAAALVGLLLLTKDLAQAQEWRVKPLIGGLPADSGLAAGLELRRTRLIGPVDGRVTAIGSVKKYEFLETAIEVPEAGRDWMSFTLAGRYRNYPQEDFWGLGPNTSQDLRSSYRLEDFDATATLTFSFGRFHTGFEAGYLKVNIGPGKDKRFPVALPSLGLSPDRRHAGPFLEYNSVDEPGDPSTGGKYRFEWTAYDPGFQRYDVDLRRFVSLGAAGRLAFRAQTTFTRTPANETAPFYLLPTAGGTDTVRGFHQYRFRDANALILNAEYRRPLNGFVDAVLFADAGRVFPHASDLGFTNLHGSGGIGGRLKFGSHVFFGVDAAFSSEGHHLWFRSGHTF